MPVKLHLPGAGLSSLTSPPGSPTPEPDETLFLPENVRKYPYRKVYVSLPFPDSLELQWPLLNEHTAQPDISGKPAKVIYAELDQELSGYLKEVTMADVDGVSIGKQYKTPPNLSTTFEINFTPGNPTDKAFYTVSRKVVDNLGVWSARLEFSARKAGPEGLARIEKAVNEVFSFRLHKMLPDMDVARLDVAVDMIGVEPLDLIGHVPKEGKRQVWIGDHGRPETVYFFEKKKPFQTPPKKVKVRTHGPQRLTLYERSAYEKQRGQPPSYGPAPVTRAEVSTRWTKKRPPLKSLATCPNRFAGRRVAYAATINLKPRPWLAFCMAAFGAGLEAPRRFWWKEGGAKLLADYRDCEGDLVNEDTWVGWQGGLKYTGLEAWIATAGAGGK
jgi:hypothetical protein